MKNQAIFDAVRLTRYGLLRAPSSYPPGEDPDEPLCRPLARLSYQLLEEKSCCAVESYFIPGDTYLSQFITVVPPEGRTDGQTADRDQQLEYLGQTAAEVLPDHIEVALTTVDLGPLGTTAAPTHRLVTTQDELSSWQHGFTGSRQSPLSSFIKQCTNIPDPSLLKVVIRKAPADEVEVSVWWVDYAANARCQTREEFARYKLHRSVPSLATAFGGTPLTTNVGLPEQYGYEYTQRRSIGDRTDVPGYTRPIGESTTESDAELAVELASMPWEYENCTTVGLHHDETLTAGYQRLDVDPWLTVGSEQLPAFCGLPAVTYPESLWAQHPGRGPPAHHTRDYFRGIGDHNSNIEQTTPDADRDSKDTAGSTPTHSVDLTPSPAIRRSTHSNIIRGGHTSSSTDTPVDALDRASEAAVWLRERGDDLTTVSKGPPELRFKATTPDGTTHCVVVGDETLTAGSVVAAAGLARQTPDVESLTVCTETTQTATDVTQWLREPFAYRTTSGGVRLYRSSQPLADGTTRAIRPTDSDPEEWYLMPDGTLYCVHEDTVCGAVSLPTDQSASQTDSDLLASLLNGIPTQYTTENTTDDPAAPPSSILNDNDKTSTDADDTTAMNVPVWLPHVASGLSDTTVLVGHGDQFRETRPDPCWDQHLASAGVDHAAASFIQTYTTDIEGRTLNGAEVVSLFTAWYYAHTGNPPTSNPMAALRRGFKNVYRRPPEDTNNITTFRQCGWVYPPL